MKQIAVLPLLALLSGCAVTPPAQQPVPDRMLGNIAQALPGDYSTVLTRQQRESGQEPLLLSVRTEPGSGHEQINFVLSQRRADEPARTFRLSLARADNGADDQLVGAFAPLDQTGRASRYCMMQFNLQSGGFSGVTDPQECRFGEGEQATGLLKEVAFDGRQLVIGDRLVRLSDGQGAADDQIHAFFRISRFSGWAGRLEGEEWRVAREFDLHSGGDYLELTDASGMSLGLVIELTRHIVSGGEPHILRLRVVDGESGDMLGESWADPDAESLGLALPDLQIGLRRE